MAVTAFAMRDDREQAFRSGFDGYVEKPISVRELPRRFAASSTGGST